MKREKSNQIFKNMDSKTITQSLQHLDCFVGAFPRDMLPEVTKLPAALVVNTDPSDRPGEHWVAIYIPIEGYAEYFDSFGLPPLHWEIKKFLDKNSPMGTLYSNRTLQSIDGVTCGNYCILYVIGRCNNIPWWKLMTLFTSNTTFNDILAQLYTL